MLNKFISDVTDSARVPGFKIRGKIDLSEHKFCDHKHCWSMLIIGIGIRDEPGAEHGADTVADENMLPIVEIFSTVKDGCTVG